MLRIVYIEDEVTPPVMVFVRVPGVWIGCRIRQVGVDHKLTEFHLFDPSGENGFQPVAVRVHFTEGMQDSRFGIDEKVFRTDGAQDGFEYLHDPGAFDHDNRMCGQFCGGEDDGDGLVVIGVRGDA